MNTNTSIHDIIKESINLLKDIPNLDKQHGCLYHQTFDENGNLLTCVAFKELSVGGNWPGVLVNEQYPNVFNVVLFDPELTLTFDSAFGQFK